MRYGTPVSAYLPLRLRNHVPIGDLIESVMQVAVVRDVELKAHIEPYCPLHALLNCPNNIDRGNLCRERCSRRMTPLCGWRAN